MHLIKRIFVTLVASLLCVHVNAVQSFSSKYEQAKSPRLIVNWQNSSVMIGDESLRGIRRGMNHQLITRGVKLVDRALAINLELVDNSDFARLTHPDAISRHEAQALAKYADYLVVLRTIDWTADAKQMVISIIDVDTRLLVYQSEADLAAEEQSEGEKVWVGTPSGYQFRLPNNCEWAATSSGYQRQCDEAEQQEPSAEHFGQELANRVIAAWSASL